ncbi:hypothetical protein COLO4_14156 [Corchorus olitorius]|uniref:Uncharacterized protein n=1 Tax=Corchorus olitorius TaxID=93759 RepID=A0A1R3JTA3_9ROSI|nr:hypothetical protein COLO4_14156 [Corchorus olitorius]
MDQTGRPGAACFFFAKITSCLITGVICAAPNYDKWTRKKDEAASSNRPAQLESDSTLGSTINK